MCFCPTHLAFALSICWMSLSNFFIMSLQSCHNCCCRQKWLSRSLLVQVCPPNTTSMVVAIGDITGHFGYCPCYDACRSFVYCRWEVIFQEYVRQQATKQMDGLRHGAAKCHPQTGCIDSCFKGRASWNVTAAPYGGAPTVLTSKLPGFYSLSRQDEYRLS